MKKIIALLLVMVVSAALLAGCSSTPEATEPTASTDTQPMTTEPTESNQTETMQTEAVESIPEETTEDLSAMGYESAVIGRDGKNITVFYDPDYVKKNSYVNSDVEVAFVGLKETCAINLKVSSYATADEYISAMVSALSEDSNYVDVALSSVEEVQYGNTTVKVATVAYSVKAYELDEKAESYSQEELEQMEYTLQETTSAYKMIELSNGVLIQIIANGKDSALETGFEGIVLKPMA